MEMNDAVRRLTGLAQDTRLRIFRLLVRAGPGGAAAGRIASQLGVPPATLSFHLRELADCELIRVERRGRSLIYSADYGSMQELMDYLRHDCCGGISKSGRAGRARQELT
ncbi:MAG: metalloregulator ArsR/SmtB family transcription factor [Gammaproteobacteria bacterium]|jgi:DNA-binding transcriptional ArsR family regulator|nr:metalloregulator ArsR/SmtB family transcription factor [Gammaproteobacteria bacterium]